MNGFIAIDKEQAMSSFDVIRRLRRIFPAVKMGHAGTLDPMATGVLPIALGKATRLLEYLPSEPKVYRADLILDLISDTQDIWGEVQMAGAVRDYSPEQLELCLQAFRGIINQIPPMYSALHHKGQRLYNLARQGIEVPRSARQVHIYDLTLLQVKKDDAGRTQLTLEVSCSAGTYVRTLCHDIGQTLGTGAVMSSLCRLRSGSFALEQSCHWQQLVEQPECLQKYLLPMDTALLHMAAVYLDHQTQLQDFCQGRFLSEPRWGGSVIAEQLVRVIWQDQLVGIGRCFSEVNGYKGLRPVKVLA